LRLRALRVLRAILPVASVESGGFLGVIKKTSVEFFSRRGKAGASNSNHLDGVSSLSFEF
jgi:hypothetical protein